MSNPFDNSSYGNTYDNTADQPRNQGSAAFDDPMLSDRPMHRMHDSSAPLPGAQGGRATVDYGVDTQQGGISRAVPGTQQNPAEGWRGAEDTGRTVGTQDSGLYDPQGVPGARGSGISGGDDGGANAFTTDRPRNVQPTQQGGVAPGGRGDLPMGKASFMDKAIGKTEKVVGKMTKNPDMHESGELRETGGAAAARGDARASHD